MDKEQWVHIYMVAQQNLVACADEGILAKAVCRMQEEVPNHVSSM
jgi:hypothetical protein